MNRVIVAGIGTDVGKTIVSAILTTLYEGDYWKPVECGDANTSDTTQIKKWIDQKKHKIYEPSYSLKAPFSPHHAARLQNSSIDLEKVIPPTTQKTLIIESAGGVFTPLTTTHTNLDLLKKWEAKWIVVSKHYLGSINHTLLTLSALKEYEKSVFGIVFNGNPNPDSEQAILTISKIPFLGRLYPEPYLDSQTIQRYAKQWRPHFPILFP